jgi:membrane protein
MNKINYILIAVAVAVIIIGFVLMTGSPSTATEYNPDIFSFRRITLAPIACLIGFLLVIVGIMYRPKEKE